MFKTEYFPVNSSVSILKKAIPQQLFTIQKYFVRVLMITKCLNDGKTPLKYEFAHFKTVPSNLTKSSGKIKMLIDVQVVANIIVSSKRLNFSLPCFIPR